MPFLETAGCWGRVGCMGGGTALSWWVVAGKTCVAAYEPLGAASLAASYVNLANPGTYDATPGTTPDVWRKWMDFQRHKTQYPD